MIHGTVDSAVAMIGFRNEKRNEAEILSILHDATMNEVGAQDVSRDATMSEVKIAIEAGLHPTPEATVW